MKKVTIIGVPEHFNFPWHLAITENAFAERGIDLQWIDVPEGTGKMSQMLKESTADLAIILTEGIVKSITDGNPVKIVQEYIASPLLWGIHVSAQGPYKTVSDLKNTKAAISRLGSGSHLMAYINAKNNDWDTTTLQFKIVDNLDGAIQALPAGTADYFMWEHFTTKPLVDDGTFRWLDNCPTPWPCFVIAATNRFIANNSGTLQHILDVINLYTQEFKSIPSIDRTLANTYSQQLEDIKEWLSLTQWSQSQLSKETMLKVQEELFTLNLIPKKIELAELMWSTS